MALQKNPARRIMRINEVVESTGYARPSLYRLEREGKFPPRIKLGTGRGGAAGWREADIDAWLEARAAGRQWAPGGAA